MFNKICVLGCGLIGSSILRAIDEKKLANVLSAYDKSKDVASYLTENFSFDVAKNIGLPEYEKEDYGQSFGKLGMREGCYLVIPVLGPSTVRDVAGSFTGMLGGDPWYNITAGKDTQHFSDFDYWASKATSGIDFRAKNIETFENLEKNSMDFYASVRSLYLQDRQKKIANSSIFNETQNDSDWEEVETQ